MRTLCASGFAVTANFCFDEPRARKLADETGCQLARADVSVESEVEALFAREAFDAVVHCAGRHRDTLLLRTSSADWNEVLRAHLTSAFLVTRCGLRVLPRGAHLLLVASRVGERGNVGQCAYASAKAGVLGLMRGAALEGREIGIAVNAICPGYAPGDEALARAQRLARARENVLPAADASESFAAFVTWLLKSNLPVSGQILRPDCRI